MEEKDQFLARVMIEASLRKEIGTYCCLPMLESDRILPRVCKSSCFKRLLTICLNCGWLLKLFDGMVRKYSLSNTKKKKNAEKDL